MPPTQPEQYTDAAVSKQDIAVLEKKATQFSARLVAALGHRAIAALIEEETKETLLKGVVLTPEGRLDWSLAEERFFKLPAQWLKLVATFLQNLIRALETKLADTLGEEMQTSVPAITVTPEAREIITSIGLEEVLTRGLVRGLEAQLVGKDGKTHPVSMTASALQSEDGSISGLVIVAKDLKEIRLVEEEKVALLEKARAELEQKVQERTKELEVKVAEMERFQKLTIDRELKMVELKKEIKKLKGQLATQDTTNTRN